MSSQLIFEGNTVYSVAPAAPLPTPTGPIIVNGGKNALPRTSYLIVTDLLAKLQAATGVEVRGQDFVWVNESVYQPILVEGAQP